MHWNSVSDFFHMGGYALYVWSSFGLCLLAMIGEPLLLRRRRRLAIAQIQESRAEHHQENSPENTQGNAA